VTGAPFDLDRREPERWLAAQFASDPARLRLAAVFAFADELAAIRGKAREPTMFAIRLAWWREAVEEVWSGGAVRKHPVVLALAAAHAEAPLPRAAADALIDAHEADIEPEPHADPAALRAWLAARDGAVLTLAAVAGDPGLDMQAHASALETAGVAWGAAGLMRAVPLLASQGRSPFPASMRASTGLQLDDLFAGHATPALKACLADLGALARSARGLRPGVQPDAFAAIACAATAPLIAARMLALDDPLRLAPRPAPLLTRLTLLRAVIDGAL
jgi:phytoene/squalene synthetase